MINIYRCYHFGDIGLATGLLSQPGYMTGRNKKPNRTAEPNRTGPSHDASEKRRPNRIEPGQLFVQTEPNLTDELVTGLLSQPGYMILYWIDLSSKSRKWAPSLRLQVPRVQYVRPHE